MTDLNDITYPWRCIKDVFQILERKPWVEEMNLYIASILNNIQQFHVGKEQCQVRREQDVELQDEMEEYLAKHPDYMQKDNSIEADDEDLLLYDENDKEFEVKTAIDPNK